MPHLQELKDFTTELAVVISVTVTVVPAIYLTRAYYLRIIRKLNDTTYRYVARLQQERQESIEKDNIIAALKKDRS